MNFNDLEQLKEVAISYANIMKSGTDVIKELHDAFTDFYRFFDYAANISPIPSEGNRDVVAARLYNDLEWCKQYYEEFKSQLICTPLLKDIEDLRELATYIVKSFDNWHSIIGNDSTIIGLFNDVGCILDSMIIPVITARKDKMIIPVIIERKPNLHTPEPQPLPAVQVVKDETHLPDFLQMRSYEMENTFDISKLYYFLIERGVIENIDEQLFADCITHANINILWEECGRLRKRNQLRCVIHVLYQKYSRDWIDNVAQNLGMKKKNIYNPNRETLGDFEKKLHRIL